MNSGTCTKKSTVSLDRDISELGNCHGKRSQILYDMCKFYRDWHVESLDVYGRSAHTQSTHFTSNGIMKFFKNEDWFCCAGMIPHDPVCFAALVRPDFFTFKKGVVRVETQGICRGQTVVDLASKKYCTRSFSQLSLIMFSFFFFFFFSSWISISCRWNASNPWTGYSPAAVAWTVDVPGVVAFIKQLVMKPWSEKHWRPELLDVFIQVCWEILTGTIFGDACIRGV